MAASSSATTSSSVRLFRCADGGQVKKGETFVQWDPYNVPILTDKTGKIEFRDMIAGVTIKRDVDEATGSWSHGHHRAQGRSASADRHCRRQEGSCSRAIPSRRARTSSSNEGQKIRAGALLAKTPRKIAKTKDITGGLPRVAELFEARRPKDAAEIAKIDGIVEIGRNAFAANARLILKDPETGAEEEHLIPLTSTSSSSRATS